MGWKTLLKSKEVDATHWSSGKGDDLNCNRCIIRVLEAADLLSSDAETGKSDPICFLWVGPADEQPSFDINNLENTGVLTTKVIKCTIDPHWNSEHIFPMELDSIESLNEAKVVVLIRDEDLDANNVASYDDLGQVVISFKDIIKNGKIINNTIVYAGKWYPVAKCPGMKRVSGQIKLAFTLVFTESSSADLLTSLQLNTIGELVKYIKHGPPKLAPARRRRPSSASSVRSLASSRVASPVRFKSRTARSDDFSTILETLETPQAGDESMPDVSGVPEGFDPLPRWEEEESAPVYQEDTEEVLIKDEATLQQEIKQWEEKKAQAEKQHLSSVIHNTSEFVVADALQQGLNSITKDKSQKIAALQSTLDALKLSTAQLESSSAQFSPESKKAKRAYSENPVPEKRMKHVSSSASAGTAVSSLELPPLTIPSSNMTHQKKNKPGSLPEIDTRAEEPAKAKTKDKKREIKDTSVAAKAPRDKPRSTSSRDKLREFKQQQKQKLRYNMPEIPANPNILYIPAETPKEVEDDMWMMGEAMGGDEAMPDEMAEEVKQPQRAVSPTDDYAHGNSTSTVRLLKAMEAERKSLHEEIAKLKALSTTISSPVPNYKSRSNTPGKEIVSSGAPTDAIDAALRRGSKEQMLDLVRLLEPSVEVYPAYYLNVMFDVVSESLIKHRNLEECFTWIDSLLKARMIDELNSKTFHQIIASLDVIGMDASRKGVVAMRLQHLLQRAWRP